MRRECGGESMLLSYRHMHVTKSLHRVAHGSLDTGLFNEQTVSAGWAPSQAALQRLTDLTSEPSQKVGDRNKVVGPWREGILDPEQHALVSSCSTPGLH